MSHFHQNNFHHHGHSYGNYGKSVKLSSVFSLVFTVATSTFLLLLLLQHVMVCQAQWLQPGFDSIRSNESPYNGKGVKGGGDDVSGVCTMWTSQVITGTGGGISSSGVAKQEKLLRRMRESWPTFSVLELNETMTVVSGGQPTTVVVQFLIYKNVILNQESGSVVAQWNMETFGYVYALSKQGGAPAAAAASTTMAGLSDNLRRFETKSLLFTVRPDSGNASVLILSAHMLNIDGQNNVTTNDSSGRVSGKGKPPPLTTVWTIQDLRLSPQFDMVVDHESSQLIVHYKDHRLSDELHVIAVQIGTGRIAWHTTLMANQISGIVVSNQRIFMGVLYDEVKNQTTTTTFGVSTNLYDNYDHSNNGINRNMIVCLDVVDGETLWEEESSLDFSFKKVFTVLEDARLLITSAMDHKTRMHYTVALSVDNGRIEFDHGSFFGSLSKNQPILSVVQASSYNIEKTGGNLCYDTSLKSNSSSVVLLLVSRTDGLFTLCTTMYQVVNQTTATAFAEDNTIYESVVDGTGMYLEFNDAKTVVVTNGTYWADSATGVHPLVRQQSLNLLSLSEPDRNVILVATDLPDTHYLMLYGHNRAVPSHCTLRYHYWTSPIQASRTRYIITAAESLTDSTFRVIALDPKNCRNIIPLCPLFELITKQRIAAGFIVLIILTACLASCCTLCCCYCCKQCNPEKSATSAYRDCSQWCDISFVVANICESMSNCMDKCCCCCCGSRSKSVYFDTFPVSSRDSDMRYQLFTTNIADEFVYVTRENNVDGTSSCSDYDTSTEDQE